MAKKPKPSVIDVKIDGVRFDPSDLDYSTVAKVIDMFTDIQKRFAGKNLILKETTRMYDDGFYWQLYERREETEEEMNKRLSIHADAIARQEARERAEFERLSKKFGGK